jgi:hypothetical protein
MAFRIAGIVSLGIVERSGDDVSAARPFSEVNGAATLAAKRELGIGCEYDLLAGWAA